ncbi:MAG: hypothetical protein JO247_19275 [Chloroflexi bacterium]|nr:hypothetical protein [Chloroflexota bacterium]
MLGLSPQNSWLTILLLLGALGFAAAARWSGRLAGDRQLMITSVGFSVGLALLALVAGLAIFR